jgi:hypothetical protein
MKRAIAVPEVPRDDKSWKQPAVLGMRKFSCRSEKKIAK